MPWNYKENVTITNGLTTIDCDQLKHHICWLTLLPDLIEEMEHMQ